MNYKVSDILVATSRFLLQDVYGKEFYYNLGDEFIVMSVNTGVLESGYIEFQFNTHDSVFKWLLIPEDIKNYLVHKNKFTQLVRKQKLILLQND